ncbi:hypothetical protein AN1V17_49380 [Vallitalea sediminicola]
MFEFLSKKYVKKHKKQDIIPLKTQLEKLEEVGISINPDIDRNQIFNVFDKEEYEEDPYGSLLIALGCEVETSQDCGKPISKNIWYLDTECIEDTGDYVSVMEKIVCLAHDSLQLSNIHDYIDMDENKAWIAFDLGEETYKWNLEFNDDWLDVKIFSMINKLLLNTNSTSQLVISVLDQSILIAFLENDKMDNLNKISKFKFEIV